MRGCGSPAKQSLAYASGWRRYQPVSTPRRSPPSTPRWNACTLPGSAAKSAAKAAQRHGYESAAKAESFHVRDVEGPPLDGELDRARAWGQQLGRPMIKKAS
jgi:hypothetical protein